MNQFILKRETIAINLVMFIVFVACMGVIFLADKSGEALDIVSILRFCQLTGLTVFAIYGLVYFEFPDVLVRWPKSPRMHFGRLLAIAVSGFPAGLICANYAEGFPLSIRAFLPVVLYLFTSALALALAGVRLSKATPELTAA